jgi:hypothetical protein
VNRYCVPNIPAVGALHCFPTCLCNCTDCAPGFGGKGNNLICTKCPEGTQVSSYCLSCAMPVYADRQHHAGCSWEHGSVMAQQRTAGFAVCLLLGTLGCSVCCTNAVTAGVQVAKGGPKSASSCYNCEHPLHLHLQLLTRIRCSACCSARPPARLHHIKALPPQCLHMLHADH